MTRSEAGIVGFSVDRVETDPGEDFPVHAAAVFGFSFFCGGELLVPPFRGLSDQTGTRSRGKTMEADRSCRATSKRPHSGVAWARGITRERPGLLAAARSEAMRFPFGA